MSENYNSNSFLKKKDYSSKKAFTEYSPNFSQQQKFLDYLEKSNYTFLKQKLFKQIKKHND